jgi:putative membrane protein
LPIGPWELAIVAIIMLVLAAIAAVVILVAVILVARAMREPNHRPPTTRVEILQERYARGEINSTEYKQRRDQIMNDSR